MEGGTSEHMATVGPWGVFGGGGVEGVSGPVSLSYARDAVEQAVLAAS